MRLPEVTGWVRDVPVRAFRNVFAGIGQLLLAADRIRGEEQSEEQSSQDAGPAAVEQHDPLRTRAPQRPPDSTGNVRLLSPEELASRSRKNAGSRAKAEPERPAARRTAQRKPAAKRPAATPAAAKTATTKTATTKTAPAKTATPATAKRIRPAAAKTARTAAKPAAQAAPPEPPLAGYDGFSVPSLRARRRNLDVDQLRALIAYERANAARPDVLSMFERRIAKLSSGT